MIASLNIIIKVFVRSFYIENASLFLFITGLCFGFMSGVEHIALAQFFISSFLLLSIPVLIWLLYGLKVITFNQALIARRENQFLFDLILFPKPQYWLTIFIVALLQFLPAIAYGLLLLIVAAKNSIYGSWFMILPALSGITLFILLRVIRSLKNPDREKRTTLLTSILNRHFIRPYPFFAIEWISRKLTGVVLSTKVFGAALLVGVLKLYTADIYDQRLLSMALVSISAANAQLIFEVHRFENFNFPLFRQLPFSFFKRVTLTVITFGALLFIELCLLVPYFPANLDHFILIQDILLLYSFPVLLYGVLYLRNMDQEIFMRIVFGSSMILIVVVLFNVPPGIIAGLNFCLGALWWYRNFYRFEFSSMPD